MWRLLSSLWSTRRVWELKRAVLGGCAPPRAGLPRPDPAWLLWNDGCVPRLARMIDEEGRFEALPILADALEEAGCRDADLLAHCRAPGPHVRGCWRIETLLVER